MGLIDRSPKAKIVRLTDDQVDRATALALERDDAYARFTSARDRLTRMYQELAGLENDFELDVDAGSLIVIRKLRG